MSAALSIAGMCHEASTVRAVRMRCWLLWAWSEHEPANANRRQQPRLLLHDAAANSGIQTETGAAGTASGLLTDPRKGTA